MHRCAARDESTGHGNPAGNAPAPLSAPRISTPTGRADRQRPRTATGRARLQPAVDRPAGRGTPCAAASRLCEDFATEPVDLHGGSLFAAKLFKLSADEHVLLILMHHMVSDAVSCQIVAAGGFGHLQCSGARRAGAAAAACIPVPGLCGMAASYPQRLADNATPPIGRAISQTLRRRSTLRDLPNYRPLSLQRRLWRSTTRSAPVSAKSPAPAEN